MRTILRYGYVPFVWALAGVIIWRSGVGASHVHVALVVAVAVAASFAAERVVPVDPRWNGDQGDARRDVAHVFVNEGSVALTLVGLPVVTAAVTVTERWPADWPFVLQVFAAILVFDLGVTLAHYASHRVGLLWRFHAVHHSVRRLYGLNGLMKHPLHQAIEAAAGFVPLLLIGIPEQVALALAACTALQLLLQHSNVDYRVGPFGRFLALNSGHRLHHLRWPGVGDVNFGLYTLIWDRMLGTYDAPGRVVTSEELGIAARLDYPTRYLPQLTEPFRRSEAAA